MPRRALRGRVGRWVPAIAGALVVAGGCHHRGLPRPPPGPQGPRPAAMPCDFTAEYPPPPARIEVIDPRHGGAGCVWIDGYYRWDSRRWAWTDGDWVRPPSGCLYAEAEAHFMAGTTREGQLCVLYPAFFSRRDGRRCDARSCTRPAPGVSPAP